MYTYEVEVFINERPEETKRIDAWRPWTAANKAVKELEKRLKETNRVQQKITIRTTRIG